MRRLAIRATCCFCGLLVIGTVLEAAKKSNLKSPDIQYLNINDYVGMVLKQGDRAVTAYNNFENSTLNFKVSYRQHRFPTVSVESSVNQSKNQVDADTTRAEGASGSAVLTQPIFPVGGRVSASYSQNSSSFENAVGTRTHSYTRPSYTLSLSQPLYVFVGNQDWRSWKQTRLNYDIAKDNYKRDLQTIELEAKALYYNVLLKIAQMEVEKTKLESSKRSNQITKALVEAGRLAAIEQSRSEVRFKQDVRRVQNGESDLKTAIFEVLQFASLKLDAKVEFTSKLSYRPVTIEEELLTRYALEHRPDYIAAKNQMALSELAVKEALESNNPTLNAAASVSRSDSGGTGYDESTTKNWSGSLSLSWPLFDSRITALQVEVARNNLENNRVELKGLERQIRTEVANAYQQVKTYEIQLEDLRTSVEQARQSVSAVRLRYQNGRDRLIDVFDSENELRSVELENLNAIVGANLAQDRLARIIGGPLEDVKP